MGESHLADLFTAEEVELLVCGSNVSGRNVEVCYMTYVQLMSGSQEWDFDALEQSTRYDGFTREHPVVKYGFFLTAFVHTNLTNPLSPPPPPPLPSLPP